MTALFAPTAAAQLRAAGLEVAYTDTGMVARAAPGRPGAFRRADVPVPYADRIGSLVRVADVRLAIGRLG